MGYESQKIAVLLALLVPASVTYAGLPPTTEVDITAGYSTEGVQAVATQVRVFGEFDGGIRYFLEGAWADRSHTSSDVFGTAYPYENRITPMETYLEKDFKTGPYQGGVRLGRYRTPFGIYSRSDHAYNGYLRPPILRYGQSYALSNFWLEGGADVFFGTPQLLLEASVGVPQETDDKRDDGVSTVLRVQGYKGNLIVGASYLNTPPVPEVTFGPGRIKFTGADFRWMQSGVQFRGEWMNGHSFDGVKTRGWYLDSIVHRPFMGNVTGVARWDFIDYETKPPFNFKRQRWTLGARTLLSRSLIGQVNLVRQSGFEPGHTEGYLDLGLTYTVRR
jgi:hypothetical protein